MDNQTKQAIMDSLWIEKYRPKSLKEIILPQRYKLFFSKILKEKEFPNILLYSNTPGTGKTSLAKILCIESGSDYLYINASSENGIDVLRQKIQKYASVKSFTGNSKVVILDEVDGTTPAFQQGLRAFLEEFYRSCRFILTCNYITKIIEPLKSRTQLCDFNMTEKGTQAEILPKINNRLQAILKFENVTFKPEIVEKIVKTFYPDIRKMIGLVQQYSKEFGIIDDNIFNYEKIDEEFYDYILNCQLTKARTYLIEKNYNYLEIYKNLFDNLVPKLKPEKQGQAIVIIANYMDQAGRSIDPEITCCAMLLELISLIQQ